MADGDYTSAVLADSPVVFCKLDETEGTTAADSSGNARNGTISGDVTLNQTGLLVEDTTPCMSFGGTNGHIDFGSQMRDALAGSSVISIEYWSNINSASTKYAIRAVLDSSDNTAFAITMQNTSMRVYAGAAPAETTRNTGDLTIALNQVRHIVAVISYVSDNIKVYVDNSLIHNGTWAFTSTSLTLGAGITSNDWLASNLASAGYFIGKLGWFALYNYGLSAQKVGNHYDVGKRIILPKFIGRPHVGNYSIQHLGI